MSSSSYDDVLTILSSASAQTRAETLRKSLDIVDKKLPAALAATVDAAADAAAAAAAVDALCRGAAALGAHAARDVRQWLVVFMETCALRVPRAVQLDALSQACTDKEWIVAQRAIQVGTRLFTRTLNYLLKNENDSGASALFVALKRMQRTMVDIACTPSADVPVAVCMQALKFLDVAVCAFSEPIDTALAVDTLGGGNAASGRGSASAAAASDTVGGGDNDGNRADFHLQMINTNAGGVDHAILSHDVLFDEGGKLASRLAGVWRRREAAQQVSSVWASVLVNCIEHVCLQRPHRLTALVPALLQIAKPVAALTSGQQTSLQHGLRRAMLALLAFRYDDVVSVSEQLMECLTGELGAPPDTVNSRALWIFKEKRRLHTLSEGFGSARQSKRRKKAPTRAKYNVAQVLASLEPVENYNASALADTVLHFMQNLPDEVPREGLLASAAGAAADSDDDGGGESDDGGIDGAFGAAIMPKVQLQAAPLPATICEKISEQSFKRLIESEARIARSGRGDLRTALLARFVTQSPLDSFPTRTLIDHITHDFGKRYPLALAWLTSEWLQTQCDNANKDHSGAAAADDDVAVLNASTAMEEDDTGDAAAAAADDNDAGDDDDAGDDQDRVELSAALGDTPVNTRYELIVRMLLGRILQNERIAYKSLAASLPAFVAELPEVTATADAVIASLCGSEQRVSIGLGILRDAVKRRPREAAARLRQLLRYTTRAESRIRDAAVRLVADDLFGASLAAHDDAIVVHAERTLAQCARSEDEIPKFEDKINTRRMELCARLKTAKREKAAAEAAGDNAEDGNGGEGATEGDGDTTMSAAAELDADEVNKALADNVVVVGDIGGGKGNDDTDAAADEIALSESENKFVEDAVVDYQRQLVEAWKASRMALFFALCKRRGSLLPKLLPIYLKSPKEMQIQMRDEIVKVVAIDEDSKDLLALFAACTKECGVLVVHLLTSLVERAAPSAAVLDAAYDFYERVDDVRVLLPVVSGFNEKQIKGLLPKLVRLDETMLRDSLIRLAKQDGKLGSPLGAGALLEELHYIDFKDDRELTLKAAKAISICFAIPALFTQDVVAVALNHLADPKVHAKLSILFLRTVIHANTHFERLRRFIVGNVLQALVRRRRIWEDSKNWKPFLEACKSTLPESCEVLVALPERRLKDVIDSRTTDFLRLLVKHRQREPHRIARTHVALIDGAARKYAKVLDEQRTQRRAARERARNDRLISQVK